MSTKIVFDFLEEFAREKVFMIVISGGDPTLHPDFEKIIDKMLLLGLLPLLGVTGVGLKRSTLDFLVSRGILNIQVSLDEFNIKKGTRIKERVARGRVDNTLDLLSDAGMIVTVAVCIHKANSKEIKPLTRYLLTRPVDRIRIIFWAETKYGIERGLRGLSVHERVSVIKLLSQLDNGRDIIVCSGYPPLSTKPVPLDSNIENPMRLVIHADGDLSTSESGEAIGRA